MYVIAKSTVAAAGGAEGGAVDAHVGLLPLPTKPPKKFVDVKKLRIGGGQVWQDHSLDDWDTSESVVIGKGC